MTTTPQSNLAADRFINQKEICAIFGISRTAIWKLTKDDTFPTGIALGRSIRYRESEVMEWAERHRINRN